MALSSGPASAVACASAVRLKSMLLLGRRGGGLGGLRAHEAVSLQRSAFVALSSGLAPAVVFLAAKAEKFALLR